MAQQMMNLFFVVLAVVVAAASAQEMAPAPSPDMGSGFSLPVSTAVVGTSLVFSLVALFRH
ncbi:hypothetical protein DCAR_0417446 [Daucus carota subsp. sativus]|uniref:Uncharacterized protein n=1 Tax=Daucus carota subsp. sativus TaxID=79200 RepID=A0A165YGI2_DAUCS|nr:hypothetical protein DCAR_0417446 [Daucus carota subsp. sativus]